MYGHEMHLWILYTGIYTGVKSSLVTVMSKQKDVNPKDFYTITVSSVSFYLLN